MKLGVYRQVLDNSVSAEARAYGFSLVVIATGYLCISEKGLPGRGGALAFLGGALLAQVTVAVAAYAGRGVTWSSGEDVRYRPWAAVHVLSVVAAVLVGWGVAEVVVPKDAAFAAAGFAALVVYQLVMALELAIALVRE